MNVSRVGIICKRGSSAARRIGEELSEWFAGREIRVEFDQVTPDLDLLVVLGGDGTLLHVASRAASHNIPVLGINLGGLGFLTEVAVDDRFRSIDEVLAGGAVVEERMMLQTRLKGVDGFSEWRFALNDVVVSKGSIDQLVELGTWMDGEYITTYRADGIIFSTPTGSTAYNLSAGGPIVQPRLRSILVTPICPFMLESRPVLLPPDCLLTTRLVVGEGDGDRQPVKVIVDGSFVWEMGPGDLIEVATAPKPLLLLTSPRMGYFEILRGKLNWGGRAGSKSK